MKRRFALPLLIVTVGLGGLLIRPGHSAEPTVDEAALQRTRKKVQMLDDIYKTAIVLITTHYVHTDDDLPAGSAFRALFEMVSEKGWHEVRLLDATGDPYEPGNTPREGFEQQAVEQLVHGETFVEEVIEKDGQLYLRAATPIPVVMDKCVMCHSHYADVPEGRAIGALSYIVPIE